MSFKSLAAAALTAGAVVVGGLALAGPAFASTHAPAPQCHEQTWNCDNPPTYPGNHCQPVITPGIENLGWVENTTGQTVTVTLDGNYYWVQTKDPNVYYGEHTTTLTLAPWESVNLAWYKNTGSHSWWWTGHCVPVTSYPQPCQHSPSLSDQSGWGAYADYNYGQQGDSRCAPCDPRPVTTTWNPCPPKQPVLAVWPPKDPCPPVVVTDPCPPKDHKPPVDPTTPPTWGNGGGNNNNGGGGNNNWPNPHDTQAPVV